MQVVKQTIEVTTFKCEACGDEFHDKHVAAAHEKTHLQSTCQHPKIWYERIVNEGSDGEGYVSIRAGCQDCLLATMVHMTDYDQTELAKIFEVLNGSEKMRVLTEVAREKVATWEQKQADFEARYGRPMTDDERVMFAREQ